MWNSGVKRSMLYVFVMADDLSSHNHPYLNLEIQKAYDLCAPPNQPTELVTLVLVAGLWRMVGTSSKNPYPTELGQLGVFKTDNQLENKIDVNNKLSTVL